MNGVSVPPWLELLLKTQFFATCPSHLLSSRNECNLFCTECEAKPPAFCYYCRSCHHSSHRVIQVRRSSYHDVVRVSELEDILDISDVQTYVINSATVVFLNERPQVRGCSVAFKASSCHNCEICNRALLDAFRFCSLGCNLKSLKKDMGVTANDEHDLDSIRVNGDHETSLSNNNADTESGAESSSEAANSWDTPPPARVYRHRRKGIPERAPFF